MTTTISAISATRESAQAQHLSLMFASGISYHDIIERKTSHDFSELDYFDKCSGKIYFNKNKEPKRYFESRELRADFM
jgi:hypothetical protein